MPGDAWKLRLVGLGLWRRSGSVSHPSDLGTSTRACGAARCPCAISTHDCGACARTGLIQFWSHGRVHLDLLESVLLERPDDACRSGTGTAATETPRGSGAASSPAAGGANTCASPRSSLCAPPLCIYPCCMRAHRNTMPVQRTRMPYMREAAVHIQPYPRAVECWLIGEPASGTQLSKGAGVWVGPPATWAGVSVHPLQTVHQLQRCDDVCGAWPHTWTAHLADQPPGAAPLA